MLNRRQTLAGLAGATLAGALPGVALARTGTIVDVAAGNPDFSTLVTAVQAAGLVETLQGPGPFTVFAPTDAAFAALPAGTLEGLLEDTEALTAILTYHVVPGLMTAEFLTGQRGRIEMVNGGFIHMDATGDGVRINRSASVTAADVQASNGVIHVIDRVLLPR
ncbi:fasciclin domain-containing protein [Rhodobaculum claviforme]|uniref:Fasciclin n=1 Tax=Rhodobaculum claviforme TaxID=1549854 RepID=A0A934TGJ2_9RHOB|nr:fasciclin domain-containing protein [Rhodobaculum claviforme]MBK5926104.1 fasciclin [Rhodobaculum claviforme]